MRACIGCGCTDARACTPPCAWAQLDPPVCTACDARAITIDGDRWLPQPLVSQVVTQEVCPAPRRRRWWRRSGRRAEHLASALKRHGGWP